MKQKQFIACLILSALSCVNAINMFADVRNEKKINMQHGSHDGTHLDQPIPFDQPDVYLDTSNAVIIIDGGGEVSYYDVEIESMTTWLTEISTQVSGIYDTIDISSLNPDEYMITITSPTGHEFEGFFQIEKQ